MHRPGEQPKEVTWEQYSEFYKDLNLTFTVSEFDCEPKVQVFCKEQDLKNKVHGSDFNATNFLSQYQIQTRQGMLLLSLVLSSFLSHTNTHPIDIVTSQRMN